jgi:hypothetical protein
MAVRHHSKGKKGKIPFGRAYDRVDWNFLRQVLHEFPQN